jgi:hypothetical protein
MRIDHMTELSHCHICDVKLIKHPLYDITVAMTCTRHGDFFIQRQRGKDAEVIFRKFERSTTQKTPSVKKERIKKVATKKESPLMRIRCDQTGAIFESQGAAARALHIGQSDISSHLKGHRPRVGGYTFSQMVDDGNGGSVPMDRPVLPKNTLRFKIPILCEQTGEIFDSINAAANKLGMSKTTIRYILSRPPVYQTVRKYTFTRVTT